MYVEHALPDFLGQKIESYEAHRGQTVILNVCPIQGSLTWKGDQTTNEIDMPVLSLSSH